MGGGIPASRVVAINPSVLGGRQASASGPVYNPSPVLALSGAVMHDEGNSGTTAFVWTLTLYRFGSQDTFPFTWAVTGNGPFPANAADFGGTYPMGSGSFAPEETEKTITVSVTGDTTFEPAESFLLTVIAGGLNTVTSIGIISNDDAAPPMPSLSLSAPVTQAEGNSGTTNLVWTLTLNRDGSTASFPYSWGTQGTGGNPASGTDFVGGTFPVGSGTFASGETSKTITVPVAGDIDVETDETFLLTVTASGLNSPTSVGTITNDDSGGGASPSYVGPDLVAQSSPTTYPPAPTLVTKVYHPVGAKLRVRAASTYADLIAGTNLIVNDASFTLTGNATTNQAGFAATLAGISTGKTFIDVRVEESPTVFSARSNPVMHGSSTVPAPQGSINFSVYSTFPLSGAITFAEPVYLTLLGDDQISLELAGAQPGTSFTLRWADNGTKNYGAVDDFNLDYVYDYALRRRSLADVIADTTGAVTLADYDTTPDAFSFTPITGAARSALVPSTSTVFSGMAAGYAAPLSLSGPWEKFQIDQGSGFGADQTSTSGVTVQNGWDLRVFVRTSASYITLARAIATVGGVSANVDVTTLSDPAQPTLVASGTAPYSGAIDFSTDPQSVGSHAFGAGQRIVQLHWLADARTITNVTIGGTTATLIASAPGMAWYGLFTNQSAASASVVVTMTSGGNNPIIAKAYTGAQLALPDPASIQATSPDYGHFTETVANPMTISGSTGPGVVSVQVSAAVTSASWSGVTPFSDVPTLDDAGAGQTNYLYTGLVPTTAQPSHTITADSYPLSSYLAFIFGKAA